MSTIVVDPNSATYFRAKDVAAEWCTTNNLPVPAISTTPHRDWGFPDPGYYRNGKIVMCLAKCANAANRRSKYAWPGAIVDGSPLGVIAHELGHHVDHVRSAGYTGARFSEILRHSVGEAPLRAWAQTYDNWFAEATRLFITNPALLRLVRPRTFAELSRRFKPTEVRPWDVVLERAPDAVLKATIRAIAQGQNL